MSGRATDMDLTACHPQLPALVAQVEARIASLWQQERGFLPRAAARAVSGRGKRLRPIMVLLAAECGGRADDRAIALAAAVELIHSASLVHDDVVDDAAHRRGRSSAKALWGNRLSVLLGDYLVAKAFTLLPEEERQRLLPHMVQVAVRMCEGQVEELRGAGRLRSEEGYLNVVRAKTGALFAFCARAGAELGGAGPHLVGRLERFGECFGVAFQIADDILDLVGTDGRSGKPEARDLSERKFTLPLILAASLGGAGVRRQLAQLGRQAEIGPEEIRRARQIVEATGALPRAWDQVARWLGRAREALEPVPEGPAKQALLLLAGAAFPLPLMPSPRARGEATPRSHA